MLKPEGAGIITWIIEQIICNLQGYSIYSIYHCGVITMYINRILENKVRIYLNDFPAVAILGPRQCGKSTLAGKISSSIPGSIFLDLEDDTDLQKLQDPKLFFAMNPDVLICIDEIQLKPGLFSSLRAILDKESQNSRLLVLGSASRDLIRQGSETLAGRIAFLELTPFLTNELKGYDLFRHLLRGGFPRSFLARNDNVSLVWRKEFIKSYLERDMPQLGFNIPARTLKRLWTMLAHISGQVLNSSQLGQSLGVSHTTVKRYIDILSQSFMVRVLSPYHANIKKRLVKSPKTYIRDSGILLALLDIADKNQLLGHPAFGQVWESFVVEQVCSNLDGWEPFFYRTAAGAEIDLILVQGQRRIGVEIKASTAPRPSRGFWNAIADIEPEHTWVIGMVDQSYPIHPNVTVTSLRGFLKNIRNFKY